MLNQPSAAVGRARVDRNLVRVGEVDGPTAILPTPVMPGMNAGPGYQSQRLNPDGLINRIPWSQAESWVPQARVTWVMPA